MLGFKGAIGISLRPVSVSIAIGSEAGRAKGSIGRRAREGGDDSIRIGLRTLIRTPLGLAPIAAPLRQFGTSWPTSDRRAMPDLTRTDVACEIRRL
jgi:hypothetical protein